LKGGPVCESIFAKGESWREGELFFDVLAEKRKRVMKRGVGRRRTNSVTASEKKKGTMLVKKKKPSCGKDEKRRRGWDLHEQVGWTLSAH